RTVTASVPDRVIAWTAGASPVSGSRNVRTGDDRLLGPSGVPAVKRFQSVSVGATGTPTALQCATACNARERGVPRRGTQPSVNARRAGDDALSIRRSSEMPNLYPVAVSSAVSSFTCCQYAA